MSSTMMPPLPIPRWAPQRRDARSFVKYEYTEKDSVWLCLDAHRTLCRDLEAHQSAYEKWGRSVKNAARMVFGFLL